MKIIISGPVSVYGVKDDLITSAKKLKALHGLNSGKEHCSRYMDDDLTDMGIAGGQVRLRFEKGKLQVVSEYVAPRKLSAKELKKLMEETVGQWSDGIGEGCFDDYCDRHDLGIDLCPRRASVKAQQVAGGKPKRVPSPLLKAAREGSLAAVRKQVEKGESPEARDKLGNTPLLLAILYEHDDVAGYLIESGADYFAICGGTNPMCVAAMQGRVKIVRMLLDRGVSPDAADRDGMTPLMWAANRSFPEVIRMLVKAGADLNARTTERDNAGKTALMFASPEAPKITRLLLDLGADPSVRDARGKSAAEEALEQATVIERMAQFDFELEEAKAQRAKAELLERAVKSRGAGTKKTGKAVRGKIAKKK